MVSAPAAAGINQVANAVRSREERNIIISPGEEAAIMGHFTIPKVCGRVQKFFFS
jgi:hypothetical protein